VNKLIILIGIIAIMLVSIVHAEANDLWCFDYKNYTDIDNLAEKAKGINYTDGNQPITNALTDFGMNKSGISPITFANYWGGPTIPASCSATAGATISTDSITGGNVVARSIKIVRDSGNELLCNYADGSTVYWMALGSYSSDTNEGYHATAVNAGTGVHGVRLNNNANRMLLNNGVSIDTVIADSAVVSFFGFMNRIFFNNGGSGGYFATDLTAATSDKWSDSLNVGDTIYLQVFKLWLSSAGINSSANMTQFVRNISESANSEYRVYYYAPNGESSNAILSITNNNGTTWVNNTNYSIFTMPQTSHDFYTRVYGNFSKVCVASVPDTTAPKLNEINMTSEGGLGQFVNLSDTFCTNAGCRLPKTNDTTPTFVGNFSEVVHASIVDNTTQTMVDCTTNDARVVTCTESSILPAGLSNLTLNWSDTSGNKNQTTFTINITTGSDLHTTNVTIFLNGSNANKSYEQYLTLIDKDYGVNLTIIIDSNITSCIDFDYMINWSCAVGNRSILLNITELNNTRFMNGNFSSNTSSSPFNISVQQDNRTDLIKIGFRVQGFTPYPSNLVISFLNRAIFAIPGKIKENIAEYNEFLYLGTKYNATNITIATGGAVSLQINTSQSLTTQNYTAYLSGYDLDARNEFSKSVLFTASDLSNASLSNHTESPLGYFDSFENNVSGRWSITDSSTGSGYTNSMSYTSGSNDDYLTIQSQSGETACTSRTGEITLGYSDLAADWRNTSLVEVDTQYSISATCGSPNCQSTGSAGVTYYITDGTNLITLKSYSVTRGSSGTTSASDRLNITLIRNGDSIDVVVNGSSSTVSIATLDINQQLKVSYKTTATSGGACTGATASASSDMRLYSIKWGGVWLESNLTNGTYYGNGNYTNCNVNTSLTNVSKMTLSWNEYKAANTQILGYVSNTCNSSSPTWESVINGVSHTFTSIGNKIGVRFILNSSINITSPVLRQYTTEVIRSSISGINLDCNNDGVADWSYNRTLNSTTSPKVANCTIFTSCTGGITCSRRFTYSTTSGGILSLDNSSMIQSLNELTVSNLTPFEPVTVWSIIADFLNVSGSKLRVYDLDVGFNGSKNISVGVRTFGNSTINAGVDNLTILVYYSKFKSQFPKNVKYFEIQPFSNNETNVTIYGQVIRYCGVFSDDYCVVNSTPIFNNTNLAYDLNYDLYVRLNVSYNKTQSNWSIDMGVNRTTPVQTNNSFVLFKSNRTIGSSLPIFGFVDLYNISDAEIARLGDPEFQWAGYCTGSPVGDCVR